MRIGIDARALSWAGLGRYSHNLLNSMSSLNNIHDFVVFGSKKFASEIIDLPKVKFVPVDDSYYSLKEQTLFLRSLLREKMDLMHFLHFNAPVFYRRPFVVTIHDLTRFFFPAQKNTSHFHQWAYEEVFRSAVIHSQGIISVSECTKSDLIRYFPQVNDRVDVIYEGVNTNIFNPRRGENEEDDLKGLGIDSSYLLFVGVWMNHKNIFRLLEAFKEVVENGYQGKLVITGKGRVHDINVSQIISKLDLNSRVILPGNVSDSLLAVLYRNADIFVFPSLYEGFGLPPLEAMACGTPVVASGVSSIPEILGDAAEYFDPLNSNDISNAIIKVINSRIIRSKLVASGTGQINSFQWEKTAKETLAFYDKVQQKLQNKTEIAISAQTAR